MLLYPIIDNEDPCLKRNCFYDYTGGMRIINQKMAFLEDNFYMRLSKFEPSLAL